MRERDLGDRLEALDAVGGLLGLLPCASLSLEQAGVVDGDGDSVGGELQQVPVVLAEGPRRERPHVQHADHPSLDDERHSEDRADAGLQQDRVDHVV